MSLLAAAANSAWIAASTPAWRRFREALAQPEAAQDALLRRQLAANHACAYGRVHGFAHLTSYAEFSGRVPLVSYEDLAPWVDRIACGEQAVLTTEAVTRLVPTSGSTGARKLIPFTASLQREFNAAIGAWIVDLARQYPAIRGGSAYWSVTPVARRPEPERPAVPMGFDDDSQYLGGIRRWIVDAVMAVPSALREIADLAMFRRVALLLLLRRADLRLISVWHPSFLTLLLESLPPAWDSLLADLERGGCADADSLPDNVRRLLARLQPQPRRAAQLRTADPSQIETIWPNLKVVSCWGDGNARFGLNDLVRRFPRVAIQPKGLLATEAFVTIPFAGKYPAALTSHFFEFITERGEVARLHELRRGRIYEVVVTTSGGLWRYRTGDQIEVADFAFGTPSLRFLGRGGHVSDYFGEKLSEGFVAQALKATLTADGGAGPCFAMLAPEEASPGKWRYTLYVEGLVPARACERLESALRENPQYAYCRDLGQLGPLRICRIPAGAYERFVAVEVEAGARLGEIKPTALSVRTDWSRHFGNGASGPGEGVDS